MRPFLAGLCLFASALLLHADPPPKFRTDADGPAFPGPAKNPKDKSAKPEWFQLVEGQFPPEGSAHAISGELIQGDHLERRFQIRVDRNDSQERAVWDLPLDATMLPYGSIFYHGAPAALQDIPIGTHLHGLFYIKDPGDKTPPLSGQYFNRKTPEIDFRRCFRLEDDFTHNAKQKQLWKIDAVDLAEMKVTASLVQDGETTGKPKIFHLRTSTRVFQGNGIGDLKSLQEGQSILLNLTWVSLYGPGRITDIWLDEPSRQLASAHQTERHRNYTREHGLAGWVSAVEDEPQVVTITLFGNVDPALFEEVESTPPPPSAGKDGETVKVVKPSLAVARESLLTYDPINDRKGASILDVQKVPVDPGSSGLQVRVKCDMLLEGFRPPRIVKFYPAAWKVIDLPREEKFEGRE